MMIDHILIAFYLLPFLMAFAFAWRKNLALYLALVPCTLFFSWALVAMYVTMIFGYLLPWFLVWLFAYKLPARQPLA
jgi:hypothetical protein